MTGFAEANHFKPITSGPRCSNIVRNMNPEEFIERLGRESQGMPLVPGYADFCSHLFVPNFTDAGVNAVEITPDNEPLLRSGYRSRQENEPPVLMRWFEGVEPQVAKLLDVILYTAPKLKEEGIKIDGDWGIVSILGVMQPQENPMPTQTMLRNALGIEYGGSGVPLDPGKYNESVAFWSIHAICTGNASSLEYRYTGPEISSSAKIGMQLNSIMESIYHRLPSEFSLSDYSSNRSHQKLAPYQEAMVKDMIRIIEAIKIHDGKGLKEALALLERTIVEGKDSMPCNITTLWGMVEEANHDLGSAKGRIVWEAIDAIIWKGLMSA